MGRKRIAFERPNNKRSASLLIIATEGQQTEPQYFNGFIQHPDYQSTKIHVEILPIGTQSNPSTVLAQLHEFAQIYDLNLAEDELWMVIDRDQKSWKIKEIKTVAQQCQQKGYQLALSNPAFELWLILHFEDVAQYDATQKAHLLANRKLKTSKNRTALTQTLLDILGSYNKSKLNIDVFLPHIQTAIQHAKILDTEPKNRWIEDQLGTRVYLIVEKIIAFSP